MLRVLVVDDEAIVLESVSQVLMSQFKGIQIETARNSREGLIKVEHFRPNIIMTDIKMPGMNGIEFIERIRKVDKVVKIIIVSAHDHFEFAKEAVKYGVEDYVLKPLTKSKLIELISQVSEKVDMEEEKRNKELDNIERYYQSIQLVEANFFNSLLLNRNILKYMPQYREILEIPLERGAVLNIEFDKLASETDAAELSHYNKKLYDCADYLKTHIKYHRPAIVSNPFLNRVFAYVEGEVDRLFWINLVQTIMERFKMRVRIGLGSVKPIDQLRDSYSESLLAMRVSEEAVCSIQAIKEIEASYEGFDQSARAMFDYFSHRNKGFKLALKHFEGEYIKMMGSKLGLEYAEAVLTEMMVKMHERCSNILSKNRKDEEYRHFLSELSSNSSMTKLKVFEKTVNDWFSKYVKIQSDSFSKVTLGAMDILKANYNSEVTLEEAALALSVTPQYLSKVFKEDTGMTFKEYMTELRLEESKQLLKRGDYSIKEICFKVGYNDTSYFIRAFKKYEGLTPKDYQKIYR
jgi:two-component system response regulator YesN